jgi:PIN domain nuclease of toxin-antitoxin system
MPDVVLDASAILAWLQSEPGAETVEDVLKTSSCAISAVNASEVASKLAEGGSDRENIQATIAALEVEVAAFDAASAVDAAILRPLTSAHGLSLADRACLALAIRLDLPVLTTDRAWARLSLPVAVTIARPASSTTEDTPSDARP